MLRPGVGYPVVEPSTLTTPRISILLPVCNAAGTLPLALRSVREQSFRDWELIAVDDGSSDGSLALLEAAAAADPRIQVLAAPHRGLVEALRAGAAAARAPWIARMDADDALHRLRLELQWARAEASPGVDVIAARVRPLGPTGEGMRLYIRWQNELVTHDEITRSLFIESPIVHPTVLLRRRSLEEAGGYRDAGWAEDFDLWHRLRENGARFEKLPRTLLAWRDGAARLTRTHPYYSPVAFHRAKLHYLLRHPLCRGPILICGAGPIGRAWARDLLAAGLEVACAIDIDPRKIGRTIARGRVPVTSFEAGLARPHGLVLGAVGSRGARDAIRERLRREGLEEGKEVLFVA